MKAKYQKVSSSCKNCNGKGYTSREAGGNEYHTFYATTRCQCTLVQTEKYINAKLSKQHKFYDNNEVYDSTHPLDNY